MCHNVAPHVVHHVVHNLGPHVAHPEEVPYPSYRQEENSWCSPHLEIRILSSLLLDFHNLWPGAPLRGTVALKLYMKALEVHMKAEEGHTKAEEQNMSVCRMAFCRRA